MLKILIAVTVGAFLGWNVPQPKFAMRAEDWVRKKLKMTPKERIVTGTGANKRS